MKQAGKFNSFFNEVMKRKKGSMKENERTKHNNLKKLFNSEIPQTPKTTRFSSIFPKGLNR